MKKLLALLLVITLVFSMFALVSCNKDKNKDDDDDDKRGGKKEEGIETLAGKTPEQLYANAQDKLSKALSFAVETNQVIVMTYEGETMNMTQTVISKRDGDNEYIMSTNDFTTAANMEAWYVDGILYANTYNGKLKTELDKETFMQQYMGKDPGESTLLDIPESWFEGMTFEQEGDKYVLKIVISEQKYEEYFANIGIAGELLGPVKYNIYFDEDGNIEKISQICDYSITQGGITINAHLDSVSLISFEDVKITPPADADTYSEGYIPGM